MRRAISLFTSLTMVVAMSITMVLAGAIAASAAPPASDQSFEGLRANDDGDDPLNYGDANTPNPVVAVGPDHVVQFVNDTLGIFSKSGTLQSATEITDFWGGAPAPSLCLTDDSNNYVTSDVFYDSLTDRWLVVTLAENGAESAPYKYDQCIAASKTGNPMGAYNFYSVPVLPGTSGGDLYFEIGATNYGLWVNDALWMTSQLGCDACPFRGTAADNVEDSVGNRVWAFNTADLESGAELRWSSTVGTGNLSGQNFPGQQGTTSGIYADVIIPATFNKASGTPPNGRNEYIVGIDYINPRNDTWRVDVNWNTSVITVAANATQITNAYNPNYNGNFDSWVTEPSPGNRLDTGYDYDIGRIVYANTAGTERLWATHGSWTNTSPPNSGFSAVEWMQWVLSGNNAPTATGGQFQNFCGSATSGAATANCTSPDSLHRWLGSIGVDKQGNMGLNYNVTSPSVNVGMRYTGRLVGDAANNLQSGDQTLVNGSGYQVGTIDGDLFTGFGTQTVTTIDPDGCTFWTTGEYFSAPPFPTNYDTDTWNTRIGAWHWSTCTPTALATAITAKGAGPAGGNAELTATLKATGTNSGVGGKTVNFTLGGNPVGSATTNNSGVATLSGVDISAYAAGTTAGEVGATFAGTTAYGNSNSTGDLLATGATSQSITFGSLANATYGDADFSVSASSDSALAVTFTAAGNCTINGSTVHITRAGSCTVTAHQDGDATYAPAATVDQTFSIAKADQTITFGALTGPTVIATAPNTAAGQLYVSATSSSNLPVRFSTNANCALTGLTHLYGTHAGTCTVTASQEGSPSFNPASTVNQSSTVAQAAQTASQSPNQATRTISQLDHQWTFSWTSGAPSSTLSAVNAGPWSVTASAGTGTVATLTLSPAAHNMQVGTHITVTGAGAYNVTNVPVTAVAANTVSYASAATGTGGVGGSVSQSLTVCSNSGLDVTILHTGSCTVTVTQAGTADYLPGGPTSFNKGVTKGTFGNTTFSPAASAKPADTPFSVTATLHASNVVADPEITPSLNAGTLSSTTPAICSVGSTTTGAATSTATVTPITNGTCTISASGTTGNDDWAARTAQSVNYTITKVNQTITFPPIPDKSFGDPDFDPGATASSGLAVTYTATGDCTIVAGPNVHITGGGSCEVTAHQAGNGIYNAAPDVSRTFNIDAVGQTITFDPLPDKVFGDPDFDVSATASSNLDVYFTASGDCTVSNDLNTATVSLTGGGSCSITAHQDGDDDFDAATPVTRSFTVYLNQTINFPPIPNKTFGAADFPISATATSGLTVTFTAVGDCTIVAGPKVHITGAGSCSVTAHQAGNGSYLAAPDVTRSFNIAARATKTVLQKYTPKTVASGGSVTAMAKVTVVGAKKTFPSGTVQFKVGASVLGTGTINAKGIAKATFTVALAPGNYKLVATYVGNTNNATSSSAPNKNNLKVT